jgi:hypothetical protein
MSEYLNSNPNRYKNLRVVPPYVMVEDRVSAAMIYGRCTSQGGIPLESRLKFSQGFLAKFNWLSRGARIIVYGLDKIMEEEAEEVQAEEEEDEDE